MELFSRMEGSSTTQVSTSFVTNVIDRTPWLVFTTNMNHIATLERSRRFRAIYSVADTFVADGWPVAVLSSLVQRRHVPRITGSDLLPSVLGRLPEKTAVCLVGNTANAARSLEALYPALQWSHFDIPKQLDLDGELLTSLIEALDGVMVAVVSLSAPRQEEISATIRASTTLATLPCGAAVDFLVGDRRRAPALYQRVGLEWLFRVTQDPRRLMKRYAQDFPLFLRYLLKQSVKPNRALAMRGPRSRLEVVSRCLPRSFPARIGCRRR